MLFKTIREQRPDKAKTWQRIADALGVTVPELRGDGDAVPDHPGGG